MFGRVGFERWGVKYLFCLQHLIMYIDKTNKNAFETLIIVDLALIEKIKNFKFLFRGALTKKLPIELVPNIYPMFTFRSRQVLAG